MKKILITGKNSYIGMSFKNWLEQNYSNEYEVESISLRNNLWKDKDFSRFDVVYHTAGVVHIKENKKNRELYYKVNRDLTFEVAKKAKKEGVKQFIFLSSMSVYGLITGVIDENTPLSPNTSYGKSKFEAEKLLLTLEDNNFKVAILRPPMVYGKGCKGNYPKLAKLAKVLPVFQDIQNKRSMIYIDNLNEFVRMLIDNCFSGLFFPQNEEYVQTSEMVRLIAEAHGKKIKLTKKLNLLIRLFNIKTVKKLFGDLVYETNISDIGNYSTILPSTNISGFVRIKECVSIGTGAAIIQGITIGENTVIGAGAVVVKDLPDNCTAVGVPAKPINFCNKRC